MSWGIMINVAQTQGYFLSGTDYWWLLIPAGLAVSLLAHPSSWWVGLWTRSSTPGCGNGRRQHLGDQGREGISTDSDS